MPSRQTFPSGILHGCSVLDVPNEAGLGEGGPGLPPGQSGLTKQSAWEVVSRFRQAESLPHGRGNPHTNMIGILPSAHSEETSPGIIDPSQTS